MADPAQQDFEIVQAGEEHLGAIADLAAARSLDRAPDPEQAGRDGFLVSDYTVDTYRARLRTAEHFYVAVKGTEVLGFLLAYSDQRVEPDEWLNRRIKTALGSFLVIKQVCVSSGAARRGVASRLYHHVLDRWNGSPVIAAVVSEPPNLASTHFHRKLGFEELTRMTPPDGKLRVVWVWRKPREALLQAQYSIAVDLYKHEDTTNWQKLNNFFYITAGLAAALAFSLGKDGAASEQVARYLGFLIAAIGVGSAATFSQMLRYGRRYLQARKQAVMELEDHLAWHGGQRIVSRDVGQTGSRWLQASPTGTFMVLLPSLIAGCWLAVIAVLALG